MGGLPGRGVKDLAMRQKLLLEEAIKNKSAFGGFSLDLIKAFHTFDRRILSHVLQRLGIPCDLNQNFWFTVGSYAVVANGGAILKSGDVCHIALSSYSCELWAVIQAFCFAVAPICVFSDCKSLCNHIQYMIEFQKINMEWPHLEWWQFLFTIFLQRKSFHQQPLSAAWVPSHVCDDIPFERLTVHDATSRGTTLQHIFHNRCADSAAKSTLKNLHGNLITNYHQKISNIFQWHLWLAQLAAALPTKPKKPTI